MMTSRIRTHEGFAPLYARPTETTRALLAVSGSCIAFLGAGLALVSSLSSLDSQDFFLFAGIGLVVSGALLAKRHVAGAWTYLVVWAATLVWSVQDTTSLSYRLVGPIILLCVLALLVPALRRWSRGRTLAILSGLIVANVLLADGLSAAAEPQHVQRFALLNVNSMKE